MNPFEKDWQSKPDTVQPKKGNRDITIVLDGSGSMDSMKESVTTELNKHFDSMRKAPGDSRWNMVQFDDPNSARGAGEAFPKTVFENKREGDLPFLASGDYVPRGSTALVDAICLTIRDVDRRTSGMEDCYKPTIMVVTDGQENSSTEFTTSKMREMIAARQKRGWEFLYIGANQDAFAVTRNYGIQNANMASYNYAGASVLSGAVASGQVGTMSTSFAGLASGAIGSGLVGAFHIASGHLAASNPIFVDADAKAAFGKLGN